MPENASTSPALRVATVAYNPGEEIERLLASLPAATSLPMRVVIADNGGATPEQTAALRRTAEEHGAEIVGDGTNLGYGAGANLAAADLTEDWILVVNPDIVFEPGCLDSLIEVSRQDAGAGCLGPRILNTDRSVYPSGRALPSLVRGTGHAMLGKVWPSNPFSRGYHDQVNVDQIREVGWLSGSCLLLPRTVWEQLGGFDDDYFMFFEDVDLGARVSKLGYRNIQVPDAVAIHEQGATWKARPEKMIRAHHDSARRYLSGVYNAPWQAPLRWGVNAGLHLHEELEVRAARKG